MTTPLDRVIGESGLVRAPGGYRLDIRLPWYRSLPLSTVDVGGLELDGQPVSPERIRFELEGKTYALADLEAQTQHVWYVLDSAFLWIEAPDASDGDHRVAVTVTVFPPYIHGLQRPVREARTLTVRGEAAHV